MGLRAVRGTASTLVLRMDLSSIGWLYARKRGWLPKRIPWRRKKRQTNGLRLREGGGGGVSAKLEKSLLNANIDGIIVIEKERDRGE